MRIAIHETTIESIESALAVSGGHLSIGRGGYVLHYAEGSTLSGYDCDTIKQACIARGLPVIDSRNVSLEKVIELAFRGPMIAVGRDANPPPWHALSYAPLPIVAAAYRNAGAEVFNLPTQP
jgi:hypothetical protein